MSRPQKSFVATLGPSPVDWLLLAEDVPVMTITRELLTKVALDLFSDRGYNAVSYADVADVVGLAKASIHHHFPAKEELAVAALDAYTDDFLHELRGSVARGRASMRSLMRYADLGEEAVRRQRSCICGVFVAEYMTLPAIWGF